MSDDRPEDASPKPAGPGDLRSGPSGPADLWASLVGSQVVVDTDTSHVCIGTLEAADDRFLTLTNVDVHDMTDSRVTKEIYALEAMKYGIRANRKRTFLRVARTVSVSRLEDVIRY